MWRERWITLIICRIVGTRVGARVSCDRLWDLTPRSGADCVEPPEQVSLAGTQPLGSCELIHARTPVQLSTVLLKGCIDHQADGRHNPHYRRHLAGIEL